MKKLKLFISLWFTMFSVAVFAQAEFEKIAITQNTQDNLAGRLLVQDVTTGEIRYILKSVLDNKFNQPTGNATQYLDGAGNPTTFPVLSQSDRVVTQVRNTTGATVTKGTVVYLTGASGGKPTIQKAQANAESTSSGTFGVIQSDINNNSNGYVVVIGTVLGLNTSSYSEGQILWLSPTTAGGFTTTKPVAPNHAVYVAIVTLASTQGSIEVKIQNGYEIDELHDVLIVSKTDNDGLLYDAASGLWKNKQITKSMVGLGNVDNTSDVNKPISTATQNALNLKENTANKNIANGYAGLGSDGKLFSNQLPSITITDTFVVGSQAAMLALTAETGDVAVRTDVNKSYILKGTNPAVLADWQELLTPTSAVTSVFGRNRAVTAQNGDYTTALVTETTNKKYQTDAQALYNDATSSIQTQLNSKANDSEVVKLTGNQSIAGSKTFATPSVALDAILINNSVGRGLRILNESGSNFGLVINNSAASSASPLVIQKAGAQVFAVSDAGLAFASNGTLIGGTGTNNFLPKYTGTTSIGNSQIFDNGSFVGIGVSTGLNRTLQIVGSTQISHKQTNSPFEMLIGQFDEAGNAAINNVANANLYFHTNNSRKMTLLANGNVGVGTNNPIRKFNVSNSGAEGIEIGVGSINDIISYNRATAAYKPLNFEAEKYSFGVGNVGIGTDNPNLSGAARALTLNSSGYGVFEINQNDVRAFNIYSNIGETYISTVTASPMIFRTTDAEKMRITPGGNLLVNSNSTGPYLDGKLNSFGNSTVPAACFKSESNSQFTTSFWNTATGTVTLQQFVYGTGQSLVGSISSNGTTTSYNIMSDYRLKEDFKSINGLDLISKIKIYDFKFKNSDFRMSGVVAHELQEVVPYAVTGEKDGKNMQQVDYSKLVPILIQSIQELKAEIELLKNK